MNDTPTEFSRRSILRRLRRWSRERHRSGRSGSGWQHVSLPPAPPKWRRRLPSIPCSHRKARPPRLRYWPVDAFGASRAGISTSEV